MEKTHDITAARRLTLPAGSIVVFDKAYTDYARYNHLNESEILFVTQQKKSANYQVVERHKVPAGKGLTRDQSLELTGTNADRPARAGSIKSATGAGSSVKVYGTSL